MVSVNDLSPHYVGDLLASYEWELPCSKKADQRRLRQVCMSQQLGNEVERQGKANKSTTPRTALSFQRKEEELA